MNHPVIRLLVVASCALVFASMVSQQAGLRGQANEVTFSEDDQKTTIDCNGSAINVTGDDNTIIAKGDCSKLTVSGDDNEVKAEIAREVLISGDDNKIVVEIVAKISISGDDNKLEWKRGVGNNRPEISNTGDDNDIKEDK